MPLWLCWRSNRICIPCIALTYRISLASVCALRPLSFLTGDVETPWLRCEHKNRIETWYIITFTDHRVKSRVKRDLSIQSTSRYLYPYPCLELGATRMIGSLAEDGSDKGLVVDVTVATITKHKTLVWFIISNFETSMKRLTGLFGHPWEARQLPHRSSSLLVV